MHGGKNVNKYADGIPYGFIISVIGSNKNYKCHSSNIECPIDKNTPCYIFKDNTCPLVGSCHNYINITQISILTILYIGHFIFHMCMMIKSHDSEKNWII